MVYRPHRELLSESLAAKTDISTLDELKEIIGNKSYFEQPVQISWNFYAHDDRIPSDLWIVCVKFKGYSNPCCVGFMHENPDNLK